MLQIITGIVKLHVPQQMALWQKQLKTYVNHSDNVTKKRDLTQIIPWSRKLITDKNAITGFNRLSHFFNTVNAMIMRNIYR